MTKPLLQVALDYVNLEDALGMLEKIEQEVDIVEAGTPLIKSEGMKNTLKSFAEASNKPLVADLKVADVADIEFNIASEYKAEYVTILASSPIENIQDGIKSAQSLNLKLVADLLGVENYCARAWELAKLGVEYIGLHCGISEQRQGKDIFSKTQEVSDVISPLGAKIVVAGGINQENINKLAGIENIAIIIVGGGITGQDDPAQAAARLRGKIQEIF